MATITAQQEPKKEIAPGQVYLETYEWVIEETTLVPVGIRVTRTPE